MVKICVYTIAKNEQQFVERWANSAKDADYLLIVDTGSTDKTVEKAKELGINTELVTISPWRFDHARNASLDLIPEDTDICVNLDMDEILTEGWRKRIEAVYNPTVNRMTYDYIWSWISPGVADLRYFGDKICARYSHRWVNAVHEVLKPNVVENSVRIPGGSLIEHYPDSTKSRSIYLPLLEIDTKEDPSNDRNAHYLGREYFFYRMYDKAIAELQRHLALPSALWLPERAASMRYIAKSYKGMGNIQEAIRWQLRAMAEDYGGKEPIMDYALTLLEKEDWHGVISACNRMIVEPAMDSYMNERYARAEGPYDLMAVAYSKLGFNEIAAGFANIAIQKNPLDERLRKNLDLIQQDIKHETTY